MFGIGAQELAVILVIALLVFGPKRLPELARSLGRGLAEFRRASSDLRRGLEDEDEADRDAAGEPAAGRIEPPAQAVGDPPPAAAAATETDDAAPAPRTGPPATPTAAETASKPSGEA